jgi:hypothetical protein
MLEWSVEMDDLRTAFDPIIEGIRGKMLLPGDPGYDEARMVWNAMIDRRPALIALQGRG